MLDIGRWRYDPKRCLSIDCKNPAAPDDKLKEYLISPELALQYAEQPTPVQLTSKRKVDSVQSVNGKC